MFRFLLITLFLFHFKSLYSNIIKGVVKDGISGKVISYCLIANVNSGKFVVSNEAGEYEIEVFSLEDSILFSCLGYKDKVLSVKDLGDTVYLEALDVKLNEVELIADYDFRGTEEIIGYTDCKVKTMSLLCFRENYYRLAVYIDAGVKYPLLLKRINMDLFAYDSSGVLFKISLTDVDTGCKCPGKVLWHKYYKYSAFKNGFNEEILSDSVFILGRVFLVIEPVVLAECGLDRKNIYWKTCESEDMVYFSNVNGGGWSPYYRKGHKKRYIVPRVGIEVVHPLNMKRKDR